MSPLLRTLLVMIVLGSLAAPAWGQQAVPLVPNPLTPNLVPAWAPIPHVRGVEHAANIRADLFRYGGHYYYYHNGTWYRGRGTMGPWKQINQPPKVFYQIGAPYFKTPPGWARGRKTGWRGEPLPPGQMKKFEGESLPPGQMKKFGGEHVPPGHMK